MIDYFQVGKQSNKEFEVIAQNLKQVRYKGKAIDHAIASEANKISPEILNISPRYSTHIDKTHCFSSRSAGPDPSLVHQWFDPWESGVHDLRGLPHTAGMSRDCHVAHRQ